jgi:hypothetical protein
MTHSAPVPVAVPAPVGGAPMVSAGPRCPGRERGGYENACAPERNQLNLARIEDGQDTRTTVMIKNIPNKMSDRDLVAYIAGVCARKVDFLYLRMDFQNGAWFLVVWPWQGFVSFLCVLRG